MAKSSKEWLQRHVTDHYVKKARQEGHVGQAVRKAGNSRGKVEAELKK